VVAASLGLELVVAFATGSGLRVCEGTAPLESGRAPFPCCRGLIAAINRNWVRVHGGFSFFRREERARFQGYLSIGV
jgi:hypothetical protein